MLLISIAYKPELSVPGSALLPYCPGAPFLGGSGGSSPPKIRRKEAKNSPERGAQAPPIFITCWKNDAFQAVQNFFVKRNFWDPPIFGTKWRPCIVIYHLYASYLALLLQNNSDSKGFLRQNMTFIRWRKKIMRPLLSIFSLTFSTS